MMDNNMHQPVDAIASPRGLETAVAIIQLGSIVTRLTEMYEEEILASVPENMRTEVSQVIQDARQASGNAKQHAMDLSGDATEPELPLPGDPNKGASVMSFVNPTSA